MSFLNKFFGNKAGEDQDKLPKAALPPSAQSRFASSVVMEYPYAPSNLIASRYEVIKILSGGMGVVFLCLDHQKDLPVALKTFKPEYMPDRDARDRFLREGDIWVQLGRHPHVVCAHSVEYGGSEHELYLVLEWVAQTEGKDDASLRAWLTPGWPLPLKQALLFALHIARGMKYATTKISGLVHRDLKPENVLIGQDMIARVTDFGLASILAGLDENKLKTRGVEGAWSRRTQLTHGGVAGTPLYMAPEQWAGELLDVRADIYAFGCILYEMVTGHFAVVGKDLDDLEQAHRMGRVGDLPASLPADVSALVRRCLTTNREGRYRSWEEVESAVANAYRRVVGRDVPGEAAIGDETRAERMAAGWSYHTIGESYSFIGRYEAAMGYFERALEIGQKERDRGLESLALLNLGNMCRCLGDAQQAIEYFQQCLAVAQESEEVFLSPGFLTYLGNAYRDLGDVQRAIGLYQQSLTFARKNGDRREEASALNSLGNAYRNLGDAQQAIDLYEQALAINREIGNRAMEGAILSNMGNAYRNLGDVQRAIDFYEQALIIAQNMGDRAGEGHALNGLGNAYNQLGDAQRALRYFEQYLVITQEIGERRGEGIVLGNLGMAYHALGNAQQAIRYYEQSIAVAQEVGDVIGFADTNLSLALLLFQQGRYAEALPKSEFAANLFARVGHASKLKNAQQLIGQLREQLKAREHWDRGVAYFDQGRWDDAIREYQAALRINPNNGVVHFNLGATYLRLGRLDEAIHELQVALRIIPDRLPEAHYCLGFAYARQGRRSDAIREAKLALQLGYEPARQLLADLGQQ